jgi:hypothetical protein
LNWVLSKRAVRVDESWYFKIYALIFGNDIYRLDSTSQQIDVAKITNIAKNTYEMSKTHKQCNCAVVLTTGKPSIMRHSDGTEMAAPTVKNICTLAVI